MTRVERLGEASLAVVLQVDRLATDLLHARIECALVTLPVRAHISHERELGDVGSVCCLEHTLGARTRADHGQLEHAGHVRCTVRDETLSEGLELHLLLGVVASTGLGGSPDVVLRRRRLRNLRITHHGLLYVRYETV